MNNIKSYIDEKSLNLNVFGHLGLKWLVLFAKMSERFIL
jgi:hypothetical protein